MFVNGKYVMDTRTQKKWFSGPKIVNKCKPAGACPSEYDEQVEFVKWLRENDYKFTSIPNATYTGYSQQAKNKAEGLNPGLPDLLVIVKNSLIFIEMKKIDRKAKTEKGCGGVSAVQKDWIEALNQCGNCCAHVAYGFEEAKSIIISLTNADHSCIIIGR